MNNAWNRIVYSCWSPVYDWLIAWPVFVDGRIQAWKLADVKQGEKVLLAGLGTGVDIQYLPNGTCITGVDISSAMLKIARKKSDRLGKPIRLLRSDVEHISLPDHSFDVVALNLILSVVANPTACFREAVRLAKPGGRIIVFDKFVANHKPPSFIRRITNLLTRPFGTDINRNFEKIIEGTGVTILEDKPLSSGSAFRTILVGV